MNKLILLFKPEKFTPSLICSFMISLLVFKILTRSEADANHVYNELGFWLFVVFVLLLSLLLMIIKNENAVRFSAVLCTVCYAFICAAEVEDFLFSAGMCVLSSVAAVFLLPKDFSFKASPRLLKRSVAVLIAAHIALVGGICCLKYLDYKTPNFDFGLFAQMFYYMKETGRQLVTSERDELLSHFAVHFSPVFYLLLPLYALIPSPLTLLTSQTAIVSLGVIPLCLLCKRFGLSNASTLLFALIYMLYPAFLGGCFFYLHENNFLLPFLLWLLYSIESEKGVSVFISALLTLSVKEDAAVYVCIIGLYCFFARKNYKCSLFLLGFSILYFLFATSFIKTHGEGIMSDSRYGDYIFDGTGLLSVIKSVIQNPAFTIKQIFKTEKLEYLLEMLIPLGFLPLFIKKAQKLILLIPFILVNLMSNYCYQYDVGYQYGFGTGAILFFLAASNYKEMTIVRRKTLLIACLCSIIIFGGSYFSKGQSIADHFIYANERKTISEVLSLIPEDAEVAASCNFIANISERKELYELIYTKHKAQYVAVDLRGEGEEFDPEGYEEIAYEEGIIALYKRIDRSPDN